MLRIKRMPEQDVEDMTIVVPGGEALCYVPASPAGVKALADHVHVGDPLPQEGLGLPVHECANYRTQKKWEN